MMFYVLMPIGIGSIRFFHCLTLDLQAEVEKRAFRLGKLLLLRFSRNLKLLESDMFSYRELVTVQWNIFFLSQQLSSSSKNLCGSGLSKHRACVHQHKKRSCVASTMIIGVAIHHVCKWTEPPHPTHPIIGVASSMCPRAQETQMRSIHNVCKLTERYHPHPTRPIIGIASSTCPRAQVTQLRSIHHVCKSLPNVIIPTPTHPIFGVASSMCPWAQETQMRSIHNVCKLTERYHPHPTHPIIGIASSTCPRAQVTQLRSIHHVCKKFAERYHPHPHPTPRTPSLA